MLGMKGKDLVHGKCFLQLLRQSLFSELGEEQQLLPQCTFRFAGLLRSSGTLRLGFLRLFDGCNSLLPFGSLQLFSHISCLRLS